jgi:hypothetical protein
LIASLPAAVLAAVRHNNFRVPVISSAANDPPRKVESFSSCAAPAAYFTRVAALNGASGAPSFAHFSRRVGASAFYLLRERRPRSTLCSAFISCVSSRSKRSLRPGERGDETEQVEGPLFVCCVCIVFTTSSPFRGRSFSSDIKTRREAPYRSRFFSDRVRIAS